MHARLSSLLRSVEVADGLNDCFVCFIFEITGEWWSGAISESFLHDVHDLLEFFLGELAFRCAVALDHCAELITGQLDIKVKLGEAAEFRDHGLRRESILSTDTKADLESVTQKASESTQSVEDGD